MSTKDYIIQGKINDKLLPESVRNVYVTLRKMTNDFANFTPTTTKSLNSLVTVINKNHPNAIVKPATVDKNLKATYDANKEAEALLEQLRAQDRQPTEDELNILRQFAGYGGMGSLGVEGKGLMYEYYTHDALVRKMWELAYMHGYSGGDILEPSVGVGRFLAYAPKTAHVTAYETNPISAEICSILYPQAEVILGEFEKRFIEANASVKNKVHPEFDLVIGNIPFGEFGGLFAGMGEKKYTHASNYVEYFITRGLDVLSPNGLLLYVIGTEVASGGKPWLEQQEMDKVKAKIASQADLIDAYRLPNGMFEHTDALCDIVVFRKK